MTVKIGIDPKLLSSGDFERIGTIKKAADYVYEYVAWVTEDHNRTLVHKNHEKRIEALLESVSDVFGNPYGRDQLMGFFIANVVKSAVQYEESRTNIKGWHILQPSVVSEMFVFDKVVEVMQQLCRQDRCMYAGVFMSELTSSHEKLLDIEVGTVVGCDDIFVDTVQWTALLEEAEEEDTSNEVVGRTLVQNSFVALSYEDMQSALEHLTEANKEII